LQAAKRRDVKRGLSRGGVRREVDHPPTARADEVGGADERPQDVAVGFAVRVGSAQQAACAWPADDIRRRDALADEGEAGVFRQDGRRNHGSVF